MQRNQTKNFPFNNYQVKNFLKELEEISSMELSKKIIEKDLNVTTNLDKGALKAELFFDKLTPKKLRKLKMPEKTKVEKMLKWKSDSNSLIDYSKGLDHFYFDFIDSNNSVNNRNIFFENFSQSEKRNPGYFSNLIEKSLEADSLKDEYLKYLGCQITPDLNINTIFSKSSLKEEGKHEKIGKSEIDSTHSKPKCSLDSFVEETSNPYHLLNFNINSVLINENEESKLNECEENKILQNFKINKFENNSAEINKEKTKEDCLMDNKNKKSSFVQNEIHSHKVKDLFDEILDIMNEFNRSEKFLLNYLKAKNSCEIEGVDSKFNTFKLSIAEFCNHLLRMIST